MTEEDKVLLKQAAVTEQVVVQSTTSRITGPVTQSAQSRSWSLGGQVD